LVIRAFGAHALLVEFDRLEEVLAAHRQLAGLPGLTELVPAARTLLAVVDPGMLPVAQLRRILQELRDEAPDIRGEAQIIELPIVYDGPDLAETAKLLGLSPESLAEAHTAAEWTVAFTGFAPGFGYLVSPDWPYEVPRLDSARTKVPAGSVGLAAGFTGAYPRETPGGWRLIGTTDAPLFNPDAASAVLLTPGTRVRFVRASAITVAPATTARSTTSNRPGIKIAEPGLLATVQDTGRVGHKHQGVARSGAFDQEALRIGNRLLGNDPRDAAFEVTMGGFRATAERDCWFAVTGAQGRMLLGGEEIDGYVAHPWRAGTELQLDWFTRGARAYLAVRGGLLATEVLGSPASDTLAGIGYPPLVAGDQLGIGEEPAAGIPGIEATVWGAPPEGVLDLELEAGPRTDWFTQDALETLFNSVWTVSINANRVGVRLDGPELVRARQGELASEGMLAGALQVPPDGRPVILGPDGPVTGGYPVIATLNERSLSTVAQARPGTQLRFRHARQ
jgi:KipI family sensor histidine kinase inhibitor